MEKVTPRPAFRSPRQWAESCLKADKASVSRIVRVFPPYDSDELIEVLFLDGTKRPCTAWLDVSGHTIDYHMGW